MGLAVQIDENSLRDAGYVNADQYTHVPVSMNLVAKILGVSASTVISYANAGYIPTTPDNKVSLADALKINFEELHRNYIKSKAPKTKLLRR